MRFGLGDTYDFPGCFRSRVKAPIYDAVWTPVTNNNRTVTYVLQGGTFNGSTANVIRTVNNNARLDSGTPAPAMPTPTRSGFSFAGWFTAASGGVQRQGSFAVTGNLRLYARWTQGNIPVTGVRVSSTSVDLNVGQTRTLTATVLPINATNQDVIWTSNNNLVATVDNSGVVIARSTGTATITVRAGNGQFSDTSTVRVTNARRNVTVRMYYHETFRREFQNNHIQTANTIIDNTGIAFDRQFNIFLSRQPGRNIPIAPLMPIDECHLGPHAPCGPHCVTRHTCSVVNLNFFQNPNNNIFSRQTDLGVMAVSAHLTHPDAGAGNGTAWGAGFAPGRTSINDFRATPPPNNLNIPNALTYNVRLLQHEISHNFGIPDHDCEPGEPCVMRLNFFNNPNFNFTTIWCSRCVRLLSGNIPQWP